MTSINADTITASDTLAIETGSRTAALFGNDGGAASLVLGDPASSAYELKAPYVPAGVTDNADLFDAKLAFSPADNTLGRADAFDSEPFWELDGGAFHIRGTNHATGGAVSYIFRIGAHDELEVVKKIAPPSGDVTYETVSKFGFKRRNENAIMADRGIVDFVSVGPSVTLASFMPYGAYTLIAGVSDAPLATKDLLDNPDHCFVAAGVDPGANVTHTFDVHTLVDGAPAAPGNTYWVNAVVREDAPGGLASTEPRAISFVL